MSFYISMYICNLIIPVIMLIGGYCMYKNPLKEINGVMGYRTKRSKKNKETWAFAHDYCGKLWIKLSLVLLIFTIIIQLPFIHSSDDVIGIMTLVLEAVQIAVLLGSVVRVEIALKRKFD